MLPMESDSDSNSNSNSGNSGVKRGDIVWVRLEFPHKWCPALVLSSTDLGVHVTFSFFQNDVVSPSTYFLDSEVLPFEEPFPFLVSHTPSSHAPLLHSALRFLGQTVVAALRCPCLTGPTQAQPPRNGSGVSSQFDPVGLLGFVLDAAVSPWVDPPRFAHAVRLVAQVHAFRSYSSMHRNKMYEETHNTGDNVMLLSSSSLGQKMHPVTEESFALEPMEKCQIISKNVEKNITIGAIRRLNTSVSAWEGNSKHLFKNKLMLISENLLHSPLDPLYMVREKLKSERQSLLGFKNTPDQGLVDICFGNSSTMSEIHISVPSNFKIHLGNYIIKSKDNALGLCCRLPDAETIICLNSKRRRLDKPASCHVLSQIGEVQESERDAYISKHTRPMISHIKMLEPEGGIQKDHQSSTCFWETTTNFTDEVQKVDLKRSGNCKSFSNPLLCFHSNKCEVDVSPATVKGMLGSDSSVYQERPQMSCISNTKPLKLKRSARTELCAVQKVDLKRSPNCKSLSNVQLPFHSDEHEVDASAANVKDNLGSNSSVYQEGLQLQMSCNGDTTPLESRSSANIALSSGDHLVEGKDSYEGVASCLIFNSKVGQPSKTEVPFSPKSLYMKFPKNFNIPSKEQLIRKFCIFGTVDSCRTRVFCYGGSAQVAFLQELDAVAAYQYAKRKAWFGDANVRFWLDPYEHKRGFKCSAHVPPSASKQTGPPLKLCLQNSNYLRQKNRKKHCSVRDTARSASKQIGPPLKSRLQKSNSLRQENSKKHCSVRYRAPSASKQIGPPLKSCLQNSNSLRQENSNKHCSVRCTTPSASKQIGPPLKSCLKNSNSLGQENRKKHRRVRFTIET